MKREDKCKVPLPSDIYIYTHTLYKYIYIYFFNCSCLSDALWARIVGITLVSLVLRPLGWAVRRFSGRSLHHLLNVQVREISAPFDRSFELETPCLPEGPLL